jgi:hypothetical protein
LSTYITNLHISGQASLESSSLLLGHLLLWSTWCPSAFFSLSLGTVSLLPSCVFFPVACALVLSMQGYIFWSPFMSESTPLCQILKETFMLLALLTSLASRVSFYSGIRCRCAVSLCSSESIYSEPQPTDSRLIGCGSCLVLWAQSGHMCQFLLSGSLCTYNFRVTLRTWC